MVDACTRARRHRQMVSLAGLIGALALLAACAASGATTVTAELRASERGPAALEGSWPAPTTTTEPPIDPATGLSISGPIGPPWPKFFLAADAKVPSVELYQSPGVRVPTGRSLAHPTHEGVPLVMLVRDEQDDWLQVQLNIRPNGATAWIKRSDVDLRIVLNHVRIELGARKLIVFNGEDEIWSTSVAPGKAGSPTPQGAFYVDALAKPHNPNGPYGAYQISFSGFSEVYERFGAGNGQAAIHGTNRPELIGQPASHGCVRMTNPDVTHLLGLAPQGTPVTIVG